MYAASCGSTTVRFSDVPFTNLPDPGAPGACQSTTSCSASLSTTGQGATPVTVSIATVTTGTTRFQSGAHLVDPFYRSTLTQATVIQQSSTTAGAGSYSTTTVTFSRPVTNLTFRLADIDSGGSWSDRVVVTDQSGRSATITSRDVNVLGVGTSADPFRNSSTVDNRSAGGNVSLRLDGPVTSISVRFWSATGTGAQNVYLGDMSFSARAC